MIIRNKGVEIKRVVQFATDVLEVKTYKQLVIKTKQWTKNLMGFEMCSLFFEDSDSKEFFTITLQDGEEKKNTKNADFTDDLQFRDDQII